MSESSTNTEASSDAHGHDDHGMGHVMSVKMLVTVFLLLVGLTILTTELAKMHLGGAEIFIAMTIATAKALLVCIFFMHLGYDKLFNAMALVASVVCAAFFVYICVADTGDYGSEIRAYEWEHPTVTPASKINELNFPPTPVPPPLTPHGPGAVPPPAVPPTPPDAPDGGSVPAPVPPAPGT